MRISTIAQFLGIVLLLSADILDVVPTTAAIQTRIYREKSRVEFVRNKEQAQIHAHEEQRQANCGTQNKEK
jgi:hypothetical protein